MSHSQAAWMSMSEPEAPRVSLQFRDTNGVVSTIWPALYGVNDVVHGGLAIFVAEKAYIVPDRVTHPRLFAVRFPGLPVDITDEVIRRWAQANGRTFSQSLQRFALVTPEERGGGLLLRLEFSSPDELLSGREQWPGQSLLQLDWGQVEEIIQSAKTKGLVQHDLRWKTEFIGEND